MQNTAVTKLERQMTNALSRNDLGAYETIVYRKILPVCEGFLKNLFYIDDVARSFVEGNVSFPDIVAEIARRSLTPNRGTGHTDVMARTNNYPVGYGTQTPEAYQGVVAEMSHMEMFKFIAESIAPAYQLNISFSMKPKDRKQRASGFLEMQETPYVPAEKIERGNN